MSSLNLPAAVGALSQLRRGLVLVGGQTGSGKTTTLAALVNDINEREARHIITIEDPIEYEHLHGRSLICRLKWRRRAGLSHGASCGGCVRRPTDRRRRDAGSRDDAVIVVAAGETGHLVLSSLPRPMSSRPSREVADSFPPERQNTIRQELSMALAAVMTQTLLPRLDGGLVPASELLMVATAPASMFGASALQHLHQEITITRRQGSTRSRNRSPTSSDAGWSIERTRSPAGHAEELERLPGEFRRACQNAGVARCDPRVAPELRSSGSNLTLPRRSTGDFNTSCTARSAFWVIRASRIASP